MKGCDLLRETAWHFWVIKDSKHGARKSASKLQSNVREVAMQLKRQPTYRP